MALEQVFKHKNYETAPSFIQELFQEITLIDFNRKKDGKKQDFLFRFTYKGKSYTLVHSFIYGWSGVEHWFRFKKPFFSRKPFSLDNSQLVELSNQFMKSVNEWNSKKEK